MQSYPASSRLAPGKVGTKVLPTCQFDMKGVGRIP